MVWSEASVTSDGVKLQYGGDGVNIFWGRKHIPLCRVCGCACVHL